mmetsp:Transcript_9985/g.32723  ORF Transcript_9985/g.32723 Transcript_9985/m.32723 type:complete len:246 (+) Transcript_9985:771-1508(+)
MVCTRAPRSSNMTSPPSAWSSCSSAAFSAPTSCWSRGSCVRTASSSVVVSLAVRAGVPTTMCRYLSWLEKNSRSFSRPSLSSLRSLMSAWLRLMTPNHPSLRRTARPSSTSTASVPLSMRSILVRHPMVRKPCGSTSRASWNASDVAMSTVAGVTARMMTEGLRTYASVICRKEATVEGSWLSVATLVKPGMSTNVSVGNLGPETVIIIGSPETCLPGPSDRAVSSSISRFTSSKSVKTSGLCEN